MAMAEPRPDPVRVQIERVLVAQNEGVVVLASDNGEYPGKILPVFIDLGQAMNIQVSLEGRMVGRPLTHDLFSTVLNEMNAIVDQVVIEEIAQNTFFANLRLELERGGKREKVTFDARPSDGIAMAVRAGAPLFVRRKVMDEAAVDRDRLLGDADEDEDGDDDEGGSSSRPRDGDPPPPPPRLDPGELERA